MIVTYNCQNMFIIQAIGSANDYLQLMALLEASTKRKEEREMEAFIISLFKWLPNCLFNVIWSILFREIESSVLSAKVTSSTK